jgi:hypothetical protein
MAGAPLTINSISSANVDLGSYVNILSKHTIKLTKDQPVPTARQRQKDQYA